jgi:sarcosine oxidase
MAGPKIAVIGLGATGSAALWQLARRGVAAIGIEQFALGHDRGSSHGATRVIRKVHFENPSYSVLMERAYAHWRDLETASKRQLLHLTGIIEIGSSSGELVRGTLAGETKGLPREQLDAKAVMHRYPAFRLPESFVGVLQPDGGFIEAAAALSAMIDVAKAHGAEISTGTKVSAVIPSATGVRIKASGGDIVADGAIIAAGPWMRGLLPDLQLPLTVTRQVVGWFKPREPALFAADRFPVFIMETPHGSHYGFPTHDDSGVKIAKHHHHNEIVDPDTYDRTVSATDEAAIRAPLSQYLPDANGTLLSAETCLYTMAPDDTFIIDHMPGYPHIVIASPCCGYGFKFSPVIGEIVADLAVGRAPAHDITQFRLQRFA